MSNHLPLTDVDGAVHDIESKLNTEEPADADIDVADFENMSGDLDAPRKVKLSESEQSALDKVREYAVRRSGDPAVIEQLRASIGGLQNGKYRVSNSVEDTVSALHSFLEHETPIKIRVHIKSLVLRIVKDSQYGTLFEVGWGSTGIDTAHRAEVEGVRCQFPMTESVVALFLEYLVCQCFVV